MKTTASSTAANSEGAVCDCQRCSLTRGACPTRDKVHSLPDYEINAGRMLRKMGLHEFVIALRVMLQHCTLSGAGYQTTHDFRTGTQTATFTISKQNYPKRDLFRAGSNLVAIPTQQCTLLCMHHPNPLTFASCFTIIALGLYSSMDG
jgi:hypothetical protein